MDSFAGKVAVITGAASGIGRGLALALADSGCSLAICDIDAEGLAETEMLVRQRGAAGVSTRVLDVADKAALKALPEAVLAAHGSVDLLFNNAGVAVVDEFAAMSEADWDWALGVNFHAVINGTRAFLPHLLQRPEAALVNISSIFAMVATPFNSVYHATKFAVRGFTESLVLELRDTPVQVHCVHPGGIKTNIARNARINRLEGEGATREDANRRFDEMAHTSPDEAAKIILRGVLAGRPRILIGADARLMDRLQRLLPMRYHRILNWLYSRGAGS